jgi:hypothetical protein
LNKQWPGGARAASQGPDDDVLAARAINASPWQPPPGMVKRQCPVCGYFFAAPSDAGALRCPDCAGIGQRTRTL